MSRNQPSFSSSFFPCRGARGTEILTFDKRGEGPYAGVSDGRAEAICGRPLGLQFYAKIGDLYIAERRQGNGAGDGADGVPFNFVNSVDVDQATGDMYFTDSSTTYTREHNTEIMINRDATGRLLKYNTRTRHITVLMAGLPYPNGPHQAFRYWLKGPKVGSYELFVDLLGYANNVRCDAKGGYWFALNHRQINATSPEHLVGVWVDAKGGEHGVMTAPKGITLSDIAEKDGKLWLGSVELDYIGLAS
ncbi:hypothetical protein HU200_057613 [Digitaria exilis]|uniref:Strictosidine synthase conserved region domain-containing protein n=1 Tax=Digitaria exilis TaxID=1010633 RepID=A0A835AJI7_9POAL|nr:hypothetical protein HU200_057613 [Digitaria exilis]